MGKLLEEVPVVFQKKIPPENSHIGT